MALLKNLYRYTVLIITLFLLVDAKCTYSRREKQLNVTCRKESHFPADIPPNAYSIVLDECKIRTLQKSDVKRFTELRIFHIAGNRLRTIDVDVFSDNRKLEVLDISRNSQIKSNVTKTLVCNLAKMNRQMRELYLSVLKIDKSDISNIIRCLENMQLTVLDLSSATNGPLNDYTFSRMTTLQVLKLGSIYPVNLRALYNLTLLNTLRLSDTKLNDIPSFYDEDTNTTLLPGLRVLYLDSNYIQTLPNRTVGLDNLEFISMRSNRLRRISSTDMSRLSTKLNTMFLNINKNIRIEQCSFSTSVVKLELRNCRIMFSRKVRYIFSNLTKMTGLSLSKNYFDQSSDVLGMLFRGLTNLTHLSLEDCSIKRIPDTTFKGLHNLVMLTLSGNRISILNANFFNDLRSLQSLNLAGNKLTTVQKDVIALFPPSLNVFDFSGNPFVCTCDLLWFMQLFRNDRFKFLKNGTNDAYKCYNPPEMQGRNLTSFNITKADCTHLSFGIKLTIILSSVTSVVAILTFAVYRFRWYIGYGYFLLRAKRREARERSDQNQYAYDAFVAYNKSDLTWIQDKLLPLLEENERMRLCVHDRDWLCGRDVIDNIVQSIESSRKTLLVVSNAFAASQWCQLEMTLAQHRLLAEDRNALVLVLLEGIERRNLTPRLILQMRQQTYLEWTDDPVGQKIFWKKLLRSLKKPSSSILHSSPKCNQTARDDGPKDEPIETSSGDETRP
ncbi:hypothetical protein LSH36_1651g00016 [Paralvinella palmiformis]|uniref:TIR domain-containing protein n=1 Tax=Paralvinella palmiformis TaxID=53620 RepID=A0AAD9ITD3_9ANNE|nr:hypothetical protein LSH36_1651g00016 [Paralvinella palmiformis]